MIYNYTKAQSTLHAVIEILSTFPGDMRARLVDAFSELDSITHLNLPEEFRGDWNFIMHELTKRGPLIDANGKICMGSVEHTLGKTRNASACKIADMIYKLFYELNCSGKYV